MVSLCILCLNAFIFMHFEFVFNLFLTNICILNGSDYFASGGKIAPCYFAILKQNSPKGYFATSVKIALILTLILTPTLNLIPTITQTKEKHNWVFCLLRQNSHFHF